LSIVVRNSIANAVATGSLVSGGALCTIVIAHLLGPRSLGVVSYAMWLVGLAVIVADLGIPSALSRFLPEVMRAEQGGAPGMRHSDGLTRSLARVFMGAVAAIMLACAAVAGLLALADPATGLAGQREIAPEHYLHNPLFWLLVAVAMGGQSVVVLVLGLLRGRQDFARLARIASVSALLQVVATALGAWLFGIAGAILGSAFLGLLPGLFLIRTLRRGGVPEGPLRTRVVRYCGTYWAGYLLQAVTTTRTEIFFLARSFGTEAVALFSVGITLANIAVQVPVLLTGSLLPHLSQHMAAGDREGAVALFRTSMRVMALMAFPCCLGLAAIAPGLIPILYGQGFADAALPTAILLGASAMSALSSVAQIYMNAAERNGFGVGVGLTGAIAVIGSGLLLIPSHGVMAAALVRGAVQLGTAGLSLWYVHRHLGASAPLPALGRILCASLLCAGTAYGLVRVIPGSVSLLAAIPAGVVVYALGLKLFRCLSPSDVDGLAQMSRMLPAPVATIVAGALDLYRVPEVRQAKPVLGVP